MYLQRRGSAGWLLAMSCTMGVCYAASINFVILDGIREMLSHFVDEPLQESMMLGWFFSACHACTAVWLGSLLWDQRVKITFEPREESS
jgi:p-aminobenzoyl-glutamate transporter AbgT